MTLRLNLVNLAWDPVSGSANYEIQLDGVKVAQAGPKAKTTKITIPEGAEHRVTIKALPSGQVQEAKFEWSSITTTPPPPPPTTASHYMRRLTDVRLHTDGDLTWVANKVQLQWAGQGYQLPESTGTPWPNGGGIFEVDTPYGPGIRMRVTPEMIYPNIYDSKLGRISWGDPPQHAFLGKTQVWEWHWMWPSADNPSGLPNEWLASEAFIFPTSDGRVGHNLCMDYGTGQNGHRFRFGFDNGSSYGPFTLGPVLQWDHWHKFRWEIKWSNSGDGHIYIDTDDARWYSFTGRTHFAAPWTVYFSLRNAADRVNGQVIANLRMTEI